MSNYDKKKIAFVEKSSEILAILAGIFLCISTIFMFTNMLTRTVADFNIRFVYELCGLCAAGTASFAIPFATFKSAHSQMDIITSHLKPKKRAVSEGISGIFTMGGICVSENAGHGNHHYCRTSYVDIQMAVCSRNVDNYYSSCAGND